MKQLIISVLVIIAISQYFWRSWSESPEQPDIANEIVQPDYQLDNIIRREYSKSGIPLRQLSAVSLEHYQELKFTYFQKPVYILYSQNKTEDWEISANESVIYDNNKLELEGDVKVISQTPTAWLDTLFVERLTVDLNQQTLASKSEVRGTSQSFDFSALGLTGDLKKQQFELKQNVKAQYRVE